MNGKHLLYEIMMYDFALQDTALFLDLRPNDRKALEAYNCFLNSLNSRKKEYEENYGILSNRSLHAQNYEDYAKTAFPWERGC